jgi:pyruvate/2-oxoglutarate dehydrogenase complex dihydrolipoamide acyltransferase (E2) component
MPEEPNPQTEPKPQDDDRRFDASKVANIVARQDAETINEFLLLVGMKAGDKISDFFKEPIVTDPATEPKKDATPTPPAPTPPAQPEPPKPPADDKPKDTDKAVEDVRREMHEMKLENARLRAIGRHEHLTEDDQKFLAGSTPDEIEASAAALNERYGAAKAAATPPADGSQDNPPANDPGKPGGDKPPAKTFPNDSKLPDPDTGPVTVDSIARIAMTPDGSKKIAEEAAAEGRRIYEGGGPKFASG